MVDNNRPVTKKDLIETLGDFFDKMILPHFERIDKRFDKVEKGLDNIETHVESIDRRLDLVTEKVTDHGKRITKLESSTVTAS